MCRLHKYACLRGRATKLAEENGKFRTTTAIAIAACASVCGSLWQIACADNCSKSIAQKFNWQQNHNHNEQRRAERGKQSLLAECQNRNAHSCRKRRSCCCCSRPDLVTRAIKGLNKACGAAPAPKDRQQTKATARPGRLTAISAGCTRFLEMWQRGKERGKGGGVGHTH